ncbi:MAG: mannose-1-phosphate guanylyltransferase/mannose-6-phosphate isomerase [Cupriavidus sp.]|nr:mannose-1-phosphate guanylyltransferase/mannose-6-phosphate isomerase [Cupriavidus sp.]MCA3193775.1 mannose-1-phosphate guanylyltransferase/mannose-6-phosphate isomerase [Cupriavidus sp.]MCA3196252.1 mannose-1-phosphate guanylyltransferase/mannose-6-phosphate isomerase [Cupriavidus sp.]MCA3203773.1 mannose-1-phosphate guanylyltransferase/mannose-6-phosphate isomerase [Cupriavidus sp.]MCA3207448.1 mannose-1-phosphate guanylyltransferase/mannose-6-phosphate isomerase [Cupriavidus sp.]
MPITAPADLLSLAAGMSGDVQSALRIRPVVLAGGSGTRLWPLSRKHYPKQLIDVIGRDSLLQSTVRRMAVLRDGGHAAADAIIVCGEPHRFMTAQQLAASGTEAQIVVEPIGRNTAPALTLAALLATAGGEDGILVAMPADHVITDAEAFGRAVAHAARFAAQGAIVTLGVPPTRADTGYGYIRIGAALGEMGHAIDSFVEKPAAELAQQYVASGEYWWNSGIFVVRASAWLDTLQRLQPDMHAACTGAFLQGRQDGPYFHPDAAAFAAIPSDSIDYAVMEHLARTDGVHGVVVPLVAGWSDLGSWDAVWDAIDKDGDGNAARGRVMYQGATSCYVHADGRLVACVGTTNLIVVETPDAVLVVDRSQVQGVKGLVERLASQQGSEAENHRKVQRPWGCYDSLDQGERFQVKHIVVHPGASLSLQLHHHRAEHWTVVRGTARVTCGEEQFLLSENESTYIPIGVTHRLENPGKLPLEVIEVQSGAYLGEDDIVRIADTYGRCA